MIVEPPGSRGQRAIEAGRGEDDGRIRRHPVSLTGLLHAGIGLEHLLETLSEVAEALQDQVFADLRVQTLHLAPVGLLQGI